MNISENIKKFNAELPSQVTLVAVSKTQSVETIMRAYNTGHRVFGENKIQEMEQKWQELPKDIQWHMIGHVQRNKVKYMAPFVDLIQAVDSLKLLKEIDKQASKNQRTISCLLQIKIAEEDSKFGLSQKEALQLLNSDALRSLQHVKIIGLMGMATFTEDEEMIGSEFERLKDFYDSLKEVHNFTELSMGMSGDYTIALEHGSTMVRIGSAIFGERNYN